MSNLVFIPNFGIFESDWNMGSQSSQYKVVLRHPILLQVELLEGNFPSNQEELLEPTMLFSDDFCVLFICFHKYTNLFNLQIK